ncbi:MAG: glycosyltransferase [Candidatus Rokubacteria bacterium]|nr:glycosyltransferase [Candidatus Rokubacteria bacterium]
MIFGSIVLNEEEYLEANLRQHYDACDRWIIVEGSDRRYPRDRVTADGCSTDRTARIVRDFPDPAGKLTYVRHGWAADKQELRNRYAEHCDGGDVVIVFDADEFLTTAGLRAVLAAMDEPPRRQPGAYVVPHVHFWHHTRQIITGGYYDVPHQRIYRWADGARYHDDHNHPQLGPGGVFLHQLGYAVRPRTLVMKGRAATHAEPCFLHCGFVKSPENMRDKTLYYVNRGEAVDRPGTTADRAAWFEPGAPAGCSVHAWAGPWPEALLPGA